MAKSDFDSLFDEAPSLSESSPSSDFDSLFDSASNEPSQYGMLGDFISGLAKTFKNPPRRQEPRTQSLVSDFGEYSKALGKEAGEYGQLAAQHPLKAAGSLAVGSGRAAAFPIDLIEKWLRNEGLITDKTDPNLAQQLLNQASEYLQENVSEEDAQKLHRLEDLGEVLPPIGLSKAVKGGANLLRKGGGSAEKLLALPGRVPKIAEKFESGLTKPRAVEAKRAERGIITPVKQKAALEGLEKETSELARKKVETNVPIIKKIEEGFDFKKRHAKEFGELKASANKFNPDIDITPISDFLAATRREYRGIPNPHPEAKKILTEIKALQRSPQTGLKNLLKIYRSNNRKIDSIFETSRLTGKQSEYVNFLKDVNREIAESIKKTLPEDSSWFKKFEQMNKDYKEYKSGEKTLNLLDPIIGKEIDIKKFHSLSVDPKKQGKLRIAMGKESADEIIQLAKDSKKAYDSLKRMKAAEYTKFETYFPLALVVPIIGKPVGALSAVWHTVKGSRRMYGNWLTKPKKVKAWDNALKAIEHKNPEAYAAATKELSEDI